MCNTDEKGENCYTLTEKEFVKFVILSICDNVNEGFIQFEKLKDNQNFAEQIVRETYEKNINKILDFINLVPEIHLKYLLIEPLYDEVTLKKDSKSAELVLKTLRCLTPLEDLTKVAYQKKIGVMTVVLELLAKNAGQNTIPSEDSTTMEFNKFDNIQKIIDETYEIKRNFDEIQQRVKEILEAIKVQNTQKMDNIQQELVQLKEQMSKLESNLNESHETEKKTDTDKMIELMTIKQKTEIDDLDIKLEKLKEIRKICRYLDYKKSGLIELVKKIKDVEKNLFSDNKERMKALVQKLPVILRATYWQQPFVLRYDEFISYLSIKSNNKVAIGKTPSTWVFENYGEDWNKVHIKSTDTDYYVNVYNHSIQLSTTKSHWSLDDVCGTDCIRIRYGHEGATEILSRYLWRIKLI